MPKSSKRQREASGSGGATAEAHPYRRGRSQTTRAAAPTSPVKATGGGRADSSLQQAEADPVMKVEETKSSKRRRRSKNRVRGTPLASPAKPNPLTETPVNEAEPSEVVRIKGEPGEIVPIVKKSTKTSQLVGASHGHALVAPEQTNPNANPAVDNQVQQEMQRKYIESQLAAEQELKALRLRVVELEKERDDGMKAVEEERKKVAEKENAIQGNEKRLAEVVDALSCGVCFEPLNDPHVLSCGHAACRGCLVQWFESRSAYSASDITEITEHTNLTYRTKLCHVCRGPVLRRPIRMFAFQNVIDLIRTGEPAKDDPLRSNTDTWDRFFPPDPTRYLLNDDEDYVVRCACCGHEVYLGECSNCGAEYSVTDTELEVLAMQSDEEGEGPPEGFSDRLSGDGSASELDDWLEEGEALGPAAQRAADQQYRLENGLTTDEDWDEEDDEDGSESAARRTGGDAHMNRLGNLLDDLAEESDGSGGSHSTEDDVLAFEGYGRDAAESDQDEHDDTGRLHLGRSARGRSNRRRGAVVPVVEDEEEEDDYESSFIDDDEPERSEASDVPVEDDSEDGIEDVDEPTVEELRRRRAARYSNTEEAPPPASRAPARGRRGRIIIDSDSE